MAATLSKYSVHDYEQVCFVKFHPLKITLQDMGPALKHYQRHASHIIIKKIQKIYSDA